MQYKQRKRIVKPRECSNCGWHSSNLEVHHYDYSKPNEIIWLCKSCHSKLHNGHEVKGEVVVYSSL